MMETWTCRYEQLPWIDQRPWSFNGALTNMGCTSIISASNMGILGRKTGISSILVGLVGGFFLPLGKIMDKSSLGGMNFPTEWKNKNVPNHQYHIMIYCDPVICGTYPISTCLRVSSQAGANIKNHRNSTVLNPPMSWDILFDAHPFDVFFWDITR